MRNETGRVPQQPRLKLVTYIDTKRVLMLLVRMLDMNCIRKGKVLIVYGLGADLHLPALRSVLKAIVSICASQVIAGILDTFRLS